MVTSMANQEAIERVIRKINVTRETLVKDANKKPRRARSSPEDHYHIAASTRLGRDLTTWLSEKRNDPAIKVSPTYVFLSMIEIVQLH